MSELLGKLTRYMFQGKITKEPKNILIIRSGAIGDVLMSTPLIHNLKDAYQDIKLSYLTGNWSKSALKNNLHLDEVISFEDKIAYQKKLFKTLKLIYKLRKRRFDLCFILDKSWHWSILAYLAGISHRIGFDRFGEGFALTQSIPFNGTKYELEYNLDLAKLLDIPIQHNNIEFYLTNKDRQFAENFLKQNKIKSKKRVILIPGGANNPGHKMQVKRWPFPSFIKLARKLSKENIKVILLGGKQDIPLAEKISAKSNAISLVGKTTIAQSTAIIENSHCIITPDSAPMHMAASTKTPIIALFGPTHPKRFAPENSKIFFKTNGCHNCYSIFTYGTLKKCRTHECMKKITVNEVFKEILKCIK